MLKLDWYSLEQLSKLEPQTLVKCLGRVKNIQRDPNFYTFTITSINAVKNNNINTNTQHRRQSIQQDQYHDKMDGNLQLQRQWEGKKQQNRQMQQGLEQQQSSRQGQSSAEAQVTIYEQMKSYNNLALPLKNCCVIVVGNTYKRQIGNKGSIIKIKLISFRIIPQQQVNQVYSIVKCSQSRRQVQSKSNSQPQSFQPKNSIIKQLKLCIQAVQIRSLILSCVYITLQNNEDLSSYTFSMSSIQNHRLTKSYIESKKLREEAVKYMCEFIDSELGYLVQNQAIQLKQVIDGKKIYKACRDFFTQIQMRVMGIINQRRKTGTFLGDIVKILNRERGFVQDKNFIFNDNFLQKVLKKFIEQSKIYKTLEKVLYPNS